MEIRTKIFKSKRFRSKKANSEKIYDLDNINRKKHSDKA